MKIENVAFPYPVLGIGNDITSNFTWHYSVDQNNYEYLITIDIQLNNESIENYIKYDLADYICEIECISTFVRKCERSKDGHFDIRLPKSLVAHEVVFELSVVVKYSIEDYENKDINPIYNGYQISLEPGDLMAYIGRGKFSADIVYEKLKRIDTFMIIREDANISQTEFKFDSYDGKIEILIPSSMYKHYKEEIKGNSNYAAIIHGSLVFNALLSALYNIDTYPDSLWARCIKTRIEKDPEIAKLNIDPSDEDDREQLPRLAQALLGDPFKRLFTGIEKIHESLNFDVED
ncbi:hypothetical protein SAMN04487900_11712 [Prevotella communis]|uniref:Uncharacterized protein n=1 Tax=Prevotella communis TaxID=2913614 RepID=A0A1H0IWP1_9BACT|nr:hypothetical protein [Prevotella communis]SDO35887.1 hypothetical protein SAMN04487900_11712 [Prevotella communis]